MQKSKQKPAKKKSRKWPSLTAVNFWLDVTLLFLFLFVLWLSFVVRFVFPSGPESAGWSLWGMSQVGWSDLQFTTICLFALAVLVHVMLHWSWVCGVISSWVAKVRGKRRPPADNGIRTLYGVALIIVIVNVLGFALAFAVLSVQGPG